MKRTPLRKRSKNPIPKLRREVWDLMSELVRREEKGRCYTCGIVKDWKEQDCGHFIHKDCMDFVRENLHCQCAKCNRFLHGNLIQYAIELEKQYGAGIIQRLKKQGDQIHRWKVSELEKLKQDCNSVIKEL